jgi:hypothetical protein
MRHEIAASAETDDGCLVIYCTDKTVITLPNWQAPRIPIGQHVLIEKIGEAEEAKTQFWRLLPKAEEVEALRNFVAMLARGDFDDQPKDTIFGAAAVLANKFNI